MASLAFAVTFLPLIASVGIGITSVALLTTGIILRLKKDTLSEENLPEVIKNLAKKDKDYIRNNNQLVNKVIEFCDKEKNVENLEKNGLLPDIIKLLAKSDENYIKSNIGFVNKVIEFCGKNKVLAELFNKECDKDIKFLSERSKNPEVDDSNELTKNLKSIDESIKKNYNLIESISSLKGGENVYKTLQGEANFENKIPSQQKNNDTEALNETVSFFENQNNKNKLIELAENHTCGIMKYDAVIDNNGTISKFEKGPNGAFLLPKKENNVDKKSKDTENYDVNLNGIEKQSNNDFNQPITLLINSKKIQTKNLDDLKREIKEKFSNNTDKIIKKILSFPGQSCCEFNLAIQSFFFNKKGRNIIPKTETIQFKIEITNDDVYLYACSKYKIFNGDSSSYEPFCIEESKKYRLNDQEEGKYTVPTLLAEHIAVFEAKPYVKDNDDLAYLKIGEKKSEFNWINPKPEELVTLDVEKDAVNDKKNEIILHKKIDK